MVLTKLQSALSDIYERAVLNHETFDVEQEIHKFLCHAGQTPEPDTNQCFLQLTRMLRYDDYNVRSSVAKFLCIICYQNFSVQSKLRSLLPITIFTNDLLVFNFPIDYKASTLVDLQKDIRKENALNKETVFWHFPRHNLKDIVEYPPSLHSATGEMLQMKIDPLDQFIGSTSVTRNKKISSSKEKLGMLERKLSDTFSSKPLERSKTLTNGIRNRKFRTANTMPLYRETEGFTPRKDEISTISPKSSRKNTIESPELSPLNTEAAEPPLVLDNKQILDIKTEHPHMNVSPTTDKDNHSTTTPKFNEPHDFWIPLKYSRKDSYNNNEKSRTHRQLKAKTPGSSRSRSQTDTGITSTTPSTFRRSPNMTERLRRAETQGDTIPLLELLQKNSEQSIEITPFIPKTPREISTLGPSHNISGNLNTKDFSMYTNASRSRFHSSIMYTRADKSAEMRRRLEEDPNIYKSEMLRETLKLLRQDRHDIYTDYDNQVQKLRLRPFEKEKFERKSFDPQKVMRKIPISKPDNKKAFLDFLNCGGKEELVEENDIGIKGNAFHGRKWNSHMSKARFSNFGKKEKYTMYVPPGVAMANPQIQSRARKLRTKNENNEIEKIKENLKMDVASSQKKYLKNVLGMGELVEEIYGEAFKKYMDVLNFEKANYNASDGSKLESAYEMVNVIYEGRLKFFQRPNSVNKVNNNIKQNEDEDKINEPQEDLDAIFAKPTRNVLRTNLYMDSRRRSMSNNSYYEKESVIIDNQSLIRNRKNAKDESPRINLQNAHNTGSPEPSSCSPTHESFRLNKLHNSPTIKG